MTTSDRDTVDVLVVQLDPHETECIACGAAHVKAQGLPMYEGWFLEAHDPGEWAGFDACWECHHAYVTGGVAALMARLATLVDNPRARELVATWQQMRGRRHVLLESPRQIEQLAKEQPDATPTVLTLDQWGVGFSVERHPSSPAVSFRRLRVHFPNRDAAGQVTYGAGVLFDHRPELERGGIRAALFRELLQDG